MSLYERDHKHLYLESKVGVEMPFGEIIEKSFKYPWKNKGLWFYGTILAFFAGGAGNYGNVDSEVAKSLQNVDYAKYVPFIILGVIVLFLLGILGAVLSSWSLAAIGKSVPQIEAGKALTRKQMGQTGKRVVWDLIKLNYLLPFAIVFGLMALVLLFVLLLGQLPQQTALGIGLILLFIGILVLIPVFIYFGIIWSLATRAIVLEDTRVIEGFKSARQVIKGNFWNTFLFSLIMGLISGSVAFLFILPFIAVIMIAVGGFAAKVYALVAVGAVIGLFYLIFYMVVLGYLQATVQTGWTLWWLELKKVKAAA